MSLINTAISNTVQRDTLQCDTTLLNALRNNPKYNYDSTFEQQGQSIFERLWEWLKDVFESSPEAEPEPINPPINDVPLNDVNWSVNDTFSQVMFWVLVVLLIAAALFLIYYYRAGLKKLSAQLFKRRKKITEKLDEGVDDIYAVDDYDSELERAESSGDLDLVARLRFMQILRMLADAKVIDWQIFKTPWQYVQELGNDDFRRYTSLYMPVRYGNLRANKALLEQMDAIKPAIIAMVNKDINEMAKGGGS